MFTDGQGHPIIRPFFFQNGNITIHPPPHRRRDIISAICCLLNKQKEWERLTFQVYKLFL